MDAIHVFAAANGGVFTRQAVHLAGHSDELIRRQLRKRRWLRLRPGIYVETERWEILDAVERHLAMARAVALRCAGDAVFSHITGALIRGWACWNVPLDMVHVTRGIGQAARVEAGVHHFQAELPEDQVETVDGFQVCSKERLMVEVARGYPFEQAVVICDAALRDNASRTEALRILSLTYTWPNSSGASRVLEFADGRAENPGESRLRVRLHLEGVRGFVPQVPLWAPDGRFLGRGDLVDGVARVLIELDGKSKYGIDGKDPWDQLWREKVREDDIRRLLHYEVCRCYWRHLDHSKALASRVLDAQARGRNRRYR